MFAALRGTVMLGAALLLALAPHAADAQAPVSYVLEAALDPSLGVVAGSARISLVNTSAAALSSLEFHLYANAFASSRSVFMREQGDKLRGVPLTRSGRIVVDALSVADGADLLAGARHGPSADDHTELHVPLPNPLAPGAAISVRVRFTLHLPSLTARMGQARDLAMIAQWFPKLARLDPSGRWVQHPYRGLGEFTADFADYDATLRVPRGHVIVAPGQLISSTTEGDTRVESYRLKHALDFAWAASPRLARFRTTAGTVEIDVYAPPPQRWLARDQADLLASAMGTLEALLGPYPHRRLVMLLPPRNGRGAAGMEYAGLIVGWLARPTAALDPTLRIAHDVVTTHELAHQWFPMLVASDEVQEPVLDEGLAQWAGMHALRGRLGRDSFWPRLVGLPVDPFDVQWALWSRSRVTASSLLAAPSYKRSELGPAVYQRPAWILERIRRTWGPARFDRTLGSYARTHRGQQVTFADLCAAFDSGYWPGFCARVLRPALEGGDAAWPAATAKPDQSRHSESSALPSPWAARVLYLSQLLLSAVGP